MYSCLNFLIFRFLLKSAGVDLIWDSCLNQKEIFFKGVEKIQQKFIGRDEEEVEKFLDEAVQEVKKNFNQEGTSSL